MKHRINAAATDGASGMRFLPSTCWTSAHPNLATRTCTPAKIASSTAKGESTEKADPKESDRQYLDVASAHQLLCIEVQHDAEHEHSESQVPMCAHPATGQERVDDE
jgi:hypothetical protein